MEARAVADLEECFSTGVRVAVKAGGDFGERIDVIVAARAGVGFEERFFFFLRTSMRFQGQVMTLTNGFSVDVNSASRAGGDLDEWFSANIQCGSKGEL